MNKLDELFSRYSKKIPLLREEDIRKDWDDEEKTLKLNGLTGTELVKRIEINLHTRYSKEYRKIAYRNFCRKHSMTGIGRFFEDPDKCKKFVPKRLGEEIKKLNIFKTPRDTREIHIYEDGIYLNTGETIIKELVRYILWEKAKNYHVSETVSYIRDTTYIERDEVNSYSAKIFLENGIFDLDKMEIVDFSPDYFSTFKLPVAYEQKADCPEFKHWLRQTLDGEGREWKMNVLQEFFGYCLLKDNRFQKAMLFYGPRRTGKSTLLHVLTAMLGFENTTSMTLHHLTEDRFAVAYMYDKSMNVFADLSDKALRDTGIFMTLSAGDQMTSAKKMGHAFTFSPFTKLVFSCNIIPTTPNKELAFYRRWILIEFPNIIPEDKVDPNIKDGLLKEISGIFKWSVDGLKRLLKNGKFSYPFNEYKVKELYEKNSDSVSSFIQTCIIEDDESSVLKRDVRRSYENYCDKHGLKCENPIKFGRWFIATTGCGTTKINNIPAYVGVILLTDNSP